MFATGREKERKDRETEEANNSTNNCESDAPTHVQIKPAARHFECIILACSATLCDLYSVAKENEKSSVLFSFLVRVRTNCTEVN